MRRGVTGEAWGGQEGPFRQNRGAMERPGTRRALVWREERSGGVEEKEAWLATLVQACLRLWWPSLWREYHRWEETLSFIALDKLDQGQEQELTCLPAPCPPSR